MLDRLIIVCFNCLKAVTERKISSTGTPGLSRRPEILRVVQAVADGYVNTLLSLYSESVVGRGIRRPAVKREGIVRSCRETVFKP